jgi:hypothetical protein
MAFGDFTVTRASTKNVLGDAGLYVSVANNVPAFEFNTDGTYRGLLVEPGATNLALHSQDFTQAAWVKIDQGVGSAPIVTSSYTTAPDGTNTGMRLQCDLNGGSTTSDRSWLQQSIVGTAVPANASLFVKLNSPGTATFAVNINDTASVTVTSTEWVRVGTVRTSATVNYNFRIGLIGGSGHSDSIDISIWQAQLETGSVATSPIVTTAGTASRVADVVSLTGASSLIGQVSGSLYVEIETNVAQSLVPINLSDGTASNRITVRRTVSNTYELAIITGGAGQVADTTAGTYTGIHRLAVRYTTDNVQMHINGAQVTSDTSATIPACSRIDLGQRESGAATFNGWIRSVALFPSYLTQAQANSLTTL